MHSAATILVVVAEVKSSAGMQVLGKTYKYLASEAEEFVDLSRLKSCHYRRCGFLLCEVPVAEVAVVEDGTFDRFG